MQQLLKQNEQFVFLVVCITGIALGVLYFQSSKNAITKIELDKFNVLSDKQSQNLSNQFNTKKNLLNVIDSFFRASESVSEEEFTVFTQKMMEDQIIDDVCLIQPNNHYYFSVHKQNIQNNVCENFDFLEQNKVIGDENPQLMMSTYVETRAGNGAFVSLLIPVLSFSIEKQDVVSFFDQYFIMFKQNNYRAHQFLFDEKLSIINEPISLNKSLAYNHSTIAAFGDVEFIYLTVLEKQHIEAGWYRNHLIIAALISISIFLIAVIIKNLINQQQKIQTIVNHRTEELSQFAYRTSHDLKSPLTTMKRLANYVEKDIQNDNHNKAINDIQKIRYQAGKLEQLVIDILDLAKADLVVNATIEKIDFSKIIYDVKDKYAQLITEYDVEIHCQLEHTIPVYSEPVRLTQIMENIISNAIKYSDPEQKPRYVKVTVMSKPDQFQIHIEDNGLGINEEYQNQIFDHFTRFHPDAALGTGMGLTITKRHIDKLAGTITLESDQNHTLFSISIPNAKAPIT